MFVSCSLKLSYYEGYADFNACTVCNTGLPKILEYWKRLLVTETLTLARSWSGR